MSNTTNEDKKAKLRRRTTLPDSVQEYMTPEEKIVKNVKPATSIMDKLLSLPKWAYLVIAGVALVVICLVLFWPRPYVEVEDPNSPFATVTGGPKTIVATATPEATVAPTIAPLDASQEDVVTVTVQGVVGDLPVIPGITVEEEQELDLSDTDLQVIIVPAEWATRITDEEINATVSVNGFSDGQRLSDGSIRYIVGLKEYNAKRIELNTQLEDKIVSYQMHSGDTYVKQVKVGHDKLSYSIYMTKVDEAKARTVAVDLLTAAKEYGLYATKTGVQPYADVYDPDGNIVKSFRVNKDGNIVTFAPDANGVMMPVQ